MRHEQLFRGLTSVDGRLGFYTKETQDHIPEVGGCYAWFLPLWIYSKNLDEQVRLVSAILDYDQDPEKEVEARFTWESILLRVRRASRARQSANIETVWDQVIADENARDLLQQTLLEASLLMPPLYVGKASNLKQRYVQHTEGRGDGNLFHSRFAAFASRLPLSISVSDLIFVCVRTPTGLTQVLTSAGVANPEDMIEQILMRFCRPPFSIK